MSPKRISVSDLNKILSQKDYSSKSLLDHKPKKSYNLKNVKPMSARPRVYKDRYSNSGFRPLDNSFSRNPFSRRRKPNLLSFFKKQKKVTFFNKL